MRAGWCGSLQKERDANDITKEERNKILQGVENYPLPEGVFFNGSKYVNWEGETLKEHPCMPQMIEDFLKNELVGNCPFPAMRALPAQPCATRCSRTCDCAGCVECVPRVGPSCPAAQLD